MQLVSKDGIACDQCGTTHKLDFTYYSFDFRVVSVISGRRLALRELLRSKIVHSLDICQQCYDNIKMEVIKNYQSTMTNDVRKRGTSNTVICEISGRKILGANYNYYLCCVTEVNVSTSGQPNICTTCRQQTRDSDKICSNCKGSSFTRTANTSTYDRLLDINVCQESFKDMVNKSELVKKQASEWSTNS